jgi:hypothetical protein
MVYQNRFVAAIKVGGKILRETSSVVTIPFGSEYSILLKNLNSLRAQVRVAVDGQDATDNTSLVVNPNSSLELERYIRNGNWERGNRFRFVERTAEVEQHRGIGADDGLVRIEFWMERAVRDVPIIRYYDPWPPPERPRDRRRLSQMSSRSRSLRPQAQSGSVVLGATTFTASMSPGLTANCLALTSDGITVPGSESGQRFVGAAPFQIESSSSVIVISLRGCVAGRRVEQPVTVDRKATCTTCGRLNKGHAQFCSRCGTALMLL